MDMYQFQRKRRTRIRLDVNLFKKKQKLYETLYLKTFLTGNFETLSRIAYSTNRKIRLGSFESKQTNFERVSKCPMMKVLRYKKTLIGTDFSIIQ